MLRSPEGKIGFVASKPPDLEFVGSVISESERVNQWSNFGPVSLVLEAYIAGLLGLPAGRAVVASASGTSALFSLIALDRLARGVDDMPWAVSAFGFWCTAQGPLADSIVVDCDERGMLDLGQLRALPREAYRGVIVTNVFGLQDDLSDYADFCRSVGKPLIVDGAAALDAAHDRAHESILGEVVSFHHTKPWGSGEGGCAIVRTADVMPMRSLSNFGLVQFTPTGRQSTNAKMSDLAAAAILDQVSRLPETRAASIEQYERVAAVGLSAGYRVLAGDGTVRESQGTPPCVPLVADRPVPASALLNDRLVLRKYYEPLSDEAATAAGLFARIVNVPCHPDVAMLSDAGVAEVLGNVLENASAG